MSVYTGAQLEHTGSYARIFLIAGSAYLLALAVVHLLVPKLQPAAFERKPAA